MSSPLRTVLLLNLSAFGVALLLSSCVSDPPASASGDRDPDGLILRAPPALAAEHDEIQASLEKAVRSGDATGEAALTVKKLLQAHFEKEEQYAMPPLALLPQLASDQPTSDLRGALATTRRLKEEYPMLLADHRAILAALSDLAAAAEQENKPEQAAFVRRLMHHAETEEQVLYPAALLVGKYLEIHELPERRHRSD